MMKRLVVAFLMVSCAHTDQVRFIDGPQARLHVQDVGGGSGVPILFVHGNGANLGQWRHQIDHLRGTRRVVAFDLRGMGESSVARNGDYSVTAMADDVQAVAEALHLQRFVIAGHSYGGAVVAAYIEKHPERVAGAVFADAAGNIKLTDEAASRFLNALRADKSKVARAWFAPILKDASEAVKEEVFASVDRTPPDALASTLDGLRSTDTVRAVNSYNGPKIAIAAAPIESPSSLHVQVPSLHVVKIAGVSHWLMLDKPEDFNRILDDFLHEVDASKPRR